MRFLIFTFSCFLLSCATPIVKNSNLENKATYICNSIMNQKPLNYKNNFSPSFIKAIPEEDLQKLIADLVQNIGLCTKTEAVVVTENAAKYKFISASKRYVELEFSIDSKNLINSLLMKNLVFSDVVISTWQDAVKYSNTWAGTASITIQNFSKSTLIGNNNLKSQPIGSGYKLYVLGALADQIKNGSLDWNQTFPIKSDWKSLPSGVMQNWENGKQVSLKTYADYMIKISDNTATDHLMYILGRSDVEAQLSVMKNSFEKSNRPFLTSAEIFKIKWAAPTDTIKSFILSDESIKRKILKKEISKISLDKVGTNGVSMTEPTFIKEIEWFGSTNDLCEAMKSLKNQNSPEVLDALSKNVPYLNLDAKSVWSYGGYKGGSEPGVITMTYLLQNKNSDWGCVSVAWHNEKKVINSWVFFDFVSKILKLSERYF